MGQYNLKYKSKYFKNVNTVRRIIRCLILVIIINCLSICKVNLKVSAYNSTETQYSNMLVKLNKLEDLAQKYKQENPSDSTSTFELILIYIRCNRYNTFEWNFLAGDKNDTFEEYVLKNSTDTDIYSLKSIYNLTIPYSNEIVDFTHMIATMNMIEEGVGVLGGFGGDICQLATNIKNETGNFDKLLSSANIKLGGNSQFGQEDIYADIDAENIMAYYKKSSNKSLANIIDEYYKSINQKERVNQFVSNVFGKLDITNENLRKATYQSFSTAPYIQMLLDSYQIGTEEYKNHVLACCYSFSDYLYNNYPKIEPSSEDDIKLKDECETNDVILSNDIEVNEDTTTTVGNTKSVNPSLSIVKEKVIEQSNEDNNQKISENISENINNQNTEVQISNQNTDLDRMQDKLMGSYNTSDNNEFIYFGMIAIVSIFTIIKVINSLERIRKEEKH